MSQYDTVILNGTIVDGTRTPRFQGSVGIKDGSIAAISRDALPASEADQVVDANGEATFIDGECTNAAPGRLLRHGTV